MKQLKKKWGVQDVTIVEISSGFVGKTSQQNPLRLNFWWEQISATTSKYMF